MGQGDRTWRSIITIEARARWPIYFGVTNVGLHSTATGQRLHPWPRFHPMAKIACARPFRFQRFFGESGKPV